MTGETSGSGYGAAGSSSKGQRCECQGLSSIMLARAGDGLLLIRGAPRKACAGSVSFKPGSRKTLEEKDDSKYRLKGKIN